MFNDILGDRALEQGKMARQMQPSGKGPASLLENVEEELVIARANVARLEELQQALQANPDIQHILELIRG